MPVQIRIEDDVMYISNCSMLPFGWTAETLLGSHASRPYNPDIARVFYRAGYIESWGRGIQKIRDACVKHGADETEYLIHGEDIMVKFNALQSAKASFKVANEALDDALERKLLNLIKEKPTVTQKEIAIATNSSRATIQRMMKKLEEKGSIERKGGKRFGYWEVH